MHVSCPEALYLSASASASVARLQLRVGQDTLIAQLHPQVVADHSCLCTGMGAGQRPTALGSSLTVMSKVH